MIEVQVSIYEGPAWDEGDLDAAATWRSPLGRLTYLAKIPPASQEYRAMLDACCAAVQPLAEAFFAEGFCAFLLFFGRTLSPELKRRFPNFNLGQEPDRLSLITPTRLELEFPLSDGDRPVGLYQIDPRKFSEVCRFLERQGAVVILSRRKDFLLAANLALMYHGSAFERQWEPSVPGYWLALASVVCPMGDVLVRTDGAFDDKERAIIVAYDPQNPAIRGQILRELVVNPSRPSRI